MTNLATLLGKRSDLDTVIGSRTLTSVEVHGIYIPASALPSRLHKFGQNLVASTHDKDYPVRLLGSATGLNYRNIKFLVCTAHQIKDVSEEDVGIVVPGKDIYMNSAGYTRFRVSDMLLEDDSYDLCAFDFTPQTTSHPELARRFFNLNRHEILTNNDEIAGYFAYGCAFDDQKYDIFDDNHLGTVIRTMTCEPQGKYADRDLGVCKMTSEMDFDPNGLSGGPVFAAVLKNTEIVLRFAGVINRSGNGIIHFIKAEAVLNLLNGTLNYKNNKH